MLNGNFQEDNLSFKAAALSKTLWGPYQAPAQNAQLQSLNWRDKSKSSPQTTSVLGPHALKQACRGLSSCN